MMVCVYVLDVFDFGGWSAIVLCLVIVFCMVVVVWFWMVFGCLLLIVLRFVLGLCSCCLLRYWILCGAFAGGWLLA